MQWLWPLGSGKEMHLLLTKGSSKLRSLRTQVIQEKYRNKIGFPRYPGQENIVNPGNWCLSYECTHNRRIHTATRCRIEQEPSIHALVHNTFFSQCCKSTWKFSEVIITCTSSRLVKLYKIFYYISLQEWILDIIGTSIF